MNGRVHYYNIYKLPYDLRGRSQFVWLALQGKKLRDAAWTLVAIGDEAAIMSKAIDTACDALSGQILYGSPLKPISGPRLIQGIRRTFGNTRQMKVCAHSDGVGTATVWLSADLSLNDQPLASIQIECRLKRVALDPSLPKDVTQADLQAMAIDTINAQLHLNQFATDWYICGDVPCNRNELARLKAS